MQIYWHSPKDLSTLQLRLSCVGIYCFNEYKIRRTIYQKEDTAKLLFTTDSPFSVRTRWSADNNERLWSLQVIE